MPQGQAPFPIIPVLYYRLELVIGHLGEGGSNARRASECSDRSSCDNRGRQRHTAGSLPKFAFRGQALIVRKVLDSFTDQGIDVRPACAVPVRLNAPDALRWLVAVCSAASAVIGSSSR
jgi:hypothetical protein